MTIISNWLNTKVLAMMIVFGTAIFMSSGCIKSQQGGETVIERETMKEGGERRETKDLTTDTRSDQFTEKQEKLDFLEAYLIMPSEVIDAEYHIVYWDNSKGLAIGPSDWEVRAALWVEAEDIPLWTADMEQILPAQIDMELWEDLKNDTLTWENSDFVECYKRPDSQSYIAVDKEHNSILKFVSTMYTP